MSFLYVKAHYGRCLSFYSYHHKPQFLTGLKDRLQKLGFRVDVVPDGTNNFCMLEMCGFEIFRCKIDNLHFNTRYDRDIVCDRAVDAVLLASIKFSRARSYLWFWTLLDYELHKRSKYGPKDFWLVKDVEEPLQKCIECSTCCGLPPESEEYARLVVHN